MQVVLELVTHLHGDFDRGGIAVGNHAHMDDVADGDAFQGDRCAVFDAGGVLKVRAEHKLARKEPAG